MAQVSKNIIRFDASDWLAGLSPQYGTSVDALPPVGFSGNTVTKAFDPFRALGYVIPSALPTSVTNDTNISNVLLANCFGVESSTNYMYAIESGSKLHQLTVSTFALSASSPWPHTITGTGAITGNDVIHYAVNISSTRTESILYSYNDGGAAWNIGRYALDGSTFDDDWLSTVPTSHPTPSGTLNPHPMVVGADDLLYIGDGNKLHAVDGATGTNSTFYDSVLTLPNNFIITSFAKLPNYLVVFAYKSLKGATITPDPTSGSQEATAFFYNYEDLDPTFVIPLNDNSVTCAFEYQSTIGCFTAGAKPVREINGADRVGRLKLWDGAKFSTVAQFIGNTPKYRGVSVVNDTIQWGSDGNVFSYGSPYENIKSGLNTLYKGTGTTNGMYALIGGALGYPVLSSGSGASGGLEKFASNYATNTTLCTTAATPELAPGQVGRIKSVTVYHGQTSSAGRTASVSLITDGATTTSVISNESAITSTELVTKVSYDTSGNPLPRFTELRLYITYSAGTAATSAPAFRYVEVEYEPDNSSP